MSSSWLPAVLVLATVVAPAAAAVTVDVGPTKPATAFIDALGITAHWDYHDTTYGHGAALADAVVALGLHHVRGYDPTISARLARQGVTTTVVADPAVGDPMQMAALVRRANRERRVIDAVEGPNEPDLFWQGAHKITYHGQGFPAGTIAYQRDLAAVFRATPELAGITLIGPSLGVTYDPPAHPNPLPVGSLAQSVDLGNFHPYPFGGNPFSQPFEYGTISRYYWTGNFPSVNLTEFPYAFRTYAPPFAPKPMAATETGYPTWRNGVTEAVQAAYLPRLCAEYFRLGIQRTYLYELADLLPDSGSGDMQRHFGIVHSNLAPKPAYTALRSLIALVGNGAEPHPAPPPPILTLSADMPYGYDRAAFVHSLVLMQSDSHALLLVWHEVADADTSVTPPRAIAVPEGRLSVEVAPPWQAAAWYAYDQGWHLARHDQTGGRTALPLQDRIVVLALRRGTDDATAVSR